MSWLIKSKVQLIVEAITNPETIISDEDIPHYLEISDGIRSMEYAPKQVIHAIRKRLEDRNPRVQLYTLKLLYFCAKNSGPRFTEQALSRQMVDDLARLIRSTNNPDVREEALHFLALWGSSETENQDLSYVRDVISQLKSENFKFPDITASEIKCTKYDTQQAPSWVNSSTCDLCHVTFTVVTRQHHCRACGNAFCGECCKKVIEIPNYGFFKPVRVCDLCYDGLISKETINSESNTDPHPVLSEEEQLRLAMEISAKEYDETLNKSVNENLVGVTKTQNANITPDPPSVMDNVKTAAPLSDPCIEFDDLTPSQVESIIMLEELIPQLRQSYQSTPGTMIEVEGTRELLEKMNCARLSLVKNISACNSEANTIQLELDEIENLEKLWNHLVTKELNNVGNSHTKELNNVSNSHTNDPHRYNFVSSYSGLKTSHHDNQTVSIGPNYAQQDDTGSVVDSHPNKYSSPVHNSEILNSIFGAASCSDNSSSHKMVPSDSPQIILIQEDYEDTENNDVGSKTKEDDIEDALISL